MGEAFLYSIRKKGMLFFRRELLLDMHNAPVVNANLAFSFLCKRVKYK